jgi:type IV secretory pathway protease TraF
MWALCAGGLRINGMPSEPVEIYWAVGKELGKGEFVLALPPAERVFALAKERGYLDPGSSPAGTCALIKRVAAVRGDRVTINAQDRTLV